AARVDESLVGAGAYDNDVDVDVLPADVDVAARGIIVSVRTDRQVVCPRPERDDLWRGAARDIRRFNRGAQSAGVSRGGIVGVIPVAGCPHQQGSTEVLANDERVKRLAL